MSSSGANDAAGEFRASAGDRQGAESRVSGMRGVELGTGDEMIGEITSLRRDQMCFVAGRAVEASWGEGSYIAKQKKTKIARGIQRGVYLDLVRSNTQLSSAQQTT